MLVRRRKCYPRTLAAITLILSILTNSWSNVGNVHNAKEPLASASEKRSGRADMPHLNPKEKLRIPEADTDHPRDDAIVSKNIAKPQLSFEANQGQADPSVKFMSHRGGYGLFFITAGIGSGFL